MRRALALLILLPVLFLSACRQSPAPAPAPTDAPGQALLDALEYSGTQSPNGVRIYLDDGAREEVYISDPDAVAQLWTAARDVRVLGESETLTTDAYHYVQFLFPDNTALSISFSGKDLQLGDACRLLSDDDPFWQAVRSLGAPAGD